MFFEIYNFVLAGFVWMDCYKKRIFFKAQCYKVNMVMNFFKKLCKQTLFLSLIQQVETKKTDHKKSRTLPFKVMFTV